MVYSYNYNSNYIPAMPLVEVDLRRMTSGNGLILTALVDSGADATMIPLDYLKRLKARKARQVRVRSVTGLSYIVDTYRVFLQVGPCRISHLTVVADRHNQQVILGRDVLLNQMVVTLNGLASVVELSQ